MVKILNSVHGVNQLTDFRRVFEHSGKRIPVDATVFYAKRAFFAPFCFKLVQNDKDDFSSVGTL